MLLSRFILPGVWSHGRGWVSHVPREPHCAFALLSDPGRTWTPSSPLKCAVTKAQDSSGRENPTRQLTLQPVAAEARMEAMKCAKPLV